MIALLMLEVAAVGAEAAVDDSEGKRLREMREQILGARERVGQHEREERAIYDRLDLLDHKIDDLAGEVASATRDAAQARDKLAATVAREASAAAQLEQTRSYMSRRVVGLYKTGEVGPLRIIFSSESLPELVNRVSFLRKLLEHDANLVVRFRREHDLLDVARREAKQHASERDETAARLQTQSRALTTERGAKSQLLARVRNDRTMERALLVELERASRALEEKLVALGESNREGNSGLDATQFAAHRGKLEAPVRGKIMSRFGRQVDAEFKTETFNNGVEFATDLGGSVRAVAFGEVRYAGWFRGYGKVVILDHGNQFFTVSGHLADLYVEVGETVDRGDTLATSGDTGSLSGPSCYFEVRKGRVPLDPEEWLQ